MTTPYNPMPALRSIILAAAPELTDVVEGGDIGKGNHVPPFVVLRRAGGPEREAQVPERRPRIRVLVYGSSAKQANEVSDKIDYHFHNRPASGTIQLPSIFNESDAIDLVDEDRRLPFVERSYFVLIQEALV